MHTKAIMNNPKAYEIINPEDFGVARRVQLVHRLTGVCVCVRVCTLHWSTEVANTELMVD